jgi:hypothetical protein
VIAVACEQLDVSLNDYDDDTRTDHDRDADWLCAIRTVDALATACALFGNATTTSASATAPISRAVSVRADTLRVAIALRAVCGGDTASACASTLVVEAVGADVLTLSNYCNQVSDCDCARRHCCRSALMPRSCRQRQCMRACARDTPHRRASCGMCSQCRRRSACRNNW